MRTANSRRGGILAGLLITGLVIAGIAVVGAIYLARSVRITEGARHGDLSIDTPGGRFEIHSNEKVDLPAMGIPVYPGATWTKDAGGASFAWVADNDADSKAFSVAGGAYVTPDSATRVVDYYKQQLSVWIVSQRHGHVEFELKEGGYRRIVAIEEKNGATHIGVVAIGKPAAN